MKRLAVLVGMFAVLAPVSASALDIPVSYRVDAKEFKNAVAGTPLVFYLHEVPGCTDPTPYQYAVLVEDVSVVVDKVKPFKVKGGEKPVKAALLQMTFPGVGPIATEGLYLTVAGTGVVPVGSDCQVQASGVPGPEGPAGPTGATGATGPTGPPLAIAVTNTFLQSVFGGVSQTLTGHLGTDSFCAVGRIDAFSTPAKCQSYLSGNQWVAYVEGHVFCNIHCFRYQ